MEDGASSLFVPDYLRPSQWRDLHRGENGNDASVKRLMLALLEISLEDAVGARRPAKRRRWNALRSPRARARAKARRSSRARARAADARTWIFGDGDGPFSFRTCCETLEIDGEKLRERIRGRSAEKRRAA